MEQINQNDFIEGIILNINNSIQLKNNLEGDKTISRTLVLEGLIGPIYYHNVSISVSLKDRISTETTQEHTRNRVNHNKTKLISIYSKLHSEIEKKYKEQLIITKPFTLKIERKDVQINFSAELITD